MTSQKLTQEEKQQRKTKWQAEIEAWKSSGLNVAQYCRDHHLNLHQFKYWQYQFAPETKRIKKPSKETVISFNPVEVIQPSMALTNAQTKQDCFELVLNGQLKLNVPMDFEELPLRRLLNCFGVL